MDAVLPYVGEQKQVQTWPACQVTPWRLLPCPAAHHGSWAVSGTAMDLSHIPLALMLECHHQCYADIAYVSIVTGR